MPKLLSVRWSVLCTSASSGVNFMADRYSHVELNGPCDQSSYWSNLKKKNVCCEILELIRKMKKWLRLKNTGILI